MWAQKACKSDPGWLDQVREAVRRIPLSASIGDMRGKVKSDRELSDLCSHHERRGTDPVFTAVMQLAIEGALDIDLSARFTDGTIVSRRQA